MIKEQKHFSILLAILLLSGFFVTSWLSYQAAHSSIEAQISKDSLPLTSNNIYSEIQHDLFKPIFISSLMAQDTFVRDWKLNGENDPQQVIKYLKEIQTKYNTVTSYFVSNASHNYYHPNGKLKVVTRDDPLDRWYFSFRNTPSQQTYEINIDHDTAKPSKMTVFVNYKVMDYEGNFIGVTGVGLALDMVKNLITSYQKRYQRTVYFTDISGNITLHGESFNNDKNLNEHINNPVIVEKILSTKSSSGHYLNQNKKVFLNSRFIDEFNWYLIVEQDALSTENDLTNTLKVNLLLSVLVTVAVLLIAHITFNRHQKNLLYMASTDKLSGLLNRQAFEPIIKNYMEQSDKQNTKLSLMLLDIDHFKKVNDTYGHLTGDKIIQHVSEICTSHLKKGDTICRWGGEEFIIALSNTSINDAVDTALNIQRSLSRSSIEPKITMSFGITTYRPKEQLDDFLLRTDDALYQAKDNGRNGIQTTL